jgi:hypothetical protein
LYRVRAKDEYEVCNNDISCSSILCPNPVLSRLGIAAEAVRAASSIVMRVEIKCAAALADKYE